MKIVHLNTSINASSAPYKLHKAMLKEGIESTLLCMNKNVDDNTVIEVHKPLRYKVKRRIATYKRRKAISNLKLQDKMPIDILPVGLDISKHLLIIEADVICIHWTNGDYLSSKEIRKIIALGKPVYQFCHDNYTFTGGCHVRMGCASYKDGCKNCPQIRDNNEKGFAYRIISKALEEKKACYQANNVTIVSPSKWMDENVASSYVLKGLKHCVLPNVIDTDIYKPITNDRVKTVRDKYNIPGGNKVLLCSIKADEKIPYNGMEYLWKALTKIASKQENLSIVTFGTEVIANNHGLNIINAGYIKETQDLIDIYSMADVMLVTSLEDSFNMTVAECIACGTPVAAFDNGGIGDIIEHGVSGYLAELRNIYGLIDGLVWFVNLRNEDYEAKNIIHDFSPKIIVKKFISTLR